MFVDTRAPYSLLDVYQRQLILEKQHRPINSINSSKNLFNYSMIYFYCLKRLKICLQCGRTKKFKFLLKDDMCRVFIPSLSSGLNRQLQAKIENKLWKFITCQIYLFNRINHHGPFVNWVSILHHLANSIFTFNPRNPLPSWCILEIQFACLMWPDGTTPRLFLHAYLHKNIQITSICLVRRFMPNEAPLLWTRLGI